MATTSSPSPSDGLGGFAGDQQRQSLYGYNSPPPRSSRSPLRSQPQLGPSPSPRHFPSPQRSSRPANPGSSLQGTGSPTRLSFYQTTPNTPSPQRYRVTNPDPPSPVPEHLTLGSNPSAQHAPKQHRQHQQQGLQQPVPTSRVTQQFQNQQPPNPGQHQQQQYHLQQTPQQQQQWRPQQPQSLSAMTQSQSLFAPAASSPLKNHSEGYHDRPRGEATSDEMYADAAESDERAASKGSHGSSGSNGRLHMSKSTEFLRNLAGKNKGHAYTALSGEDDDEELLRDPAMAQPKRHSIASFDTRNIAPGPSTPHTAQSAWTGGKEGITSDFPEPPMRQPTNDAIFVSDHGFSSQESFTTARGSNHASGATSPLSHGGHSAARPRSKPWPAQASPQTTTGPRVEDPQTLSGPHSRSALYAAETGGMLMFDGENFQRGRGPSAASSQFIPPGPLSDSHSSENHRSSNGSSNRLDFTKPRAAPMPDWNEPGPPMSWVAPGDWTSEWRDPRAGMQARRPTRHARSYSDGVQMLNRQGTLLHPESSGERLSDELGLMLGKPRNRRLSTGRLLPPPDVAKLKKPDHVRLEASKKRRARVELDVVLERECAVEGGDLRGRLEIVVHGGKRTNTLRVGHGKMRVIGFEEVDGHRHIFYQHQYPLPVFQHWPNGPRTSLFGDEPDEEGFCDAKEGTHAIPFSIPLPVGEGAKGTYTSHDPKGPNVRYVVVGSVKIFVPKKEKRAIAHFYRPCVILPYLNPAVVLSPARAPIMTQRTCGLGWSIGGEKGKVLMQVALGRRIWVAGQRVWCEVAVKNDSNKKINKCSLAVIQTVNVYMPKKGKQAMSREPTTSHRRKVAEETVEADFMDLGGGHVTGKGWWTGLEPGEGNRWDLSCPIPGGMLTIPRSRFVEVLFTLRVTLNNSIFVDMPIEAINFLSIDPPPMPNDTRRVGGRMPILLRPDESLSFSAGTGSLSQLQPTTVTTGTTGESTTLSRMADGNLGTVSTAGGGYDLDLLRRAGQTPERDADGISNANPSSTTLHIDTIAQNARISQQSQQSQQSEAAALAAQVPRSAPATGTQQVTQDLAPRAASPESQYSTLRREGSTGQTMASRDGRRDVFSDSGHSIDEDERNLLESEQARREGRASIAQTLAMENEQKKHEAETAAAVAAAAALTTPALTGPFDSTTTTPMSSPPAPPASATVPMATLAVPQDRDDLESVTSERLPEEERKTYAPARDPKEKEYNMAAPEAASDDDEYTDAEDEESTPHGSPTFPPLQMAPRPLYLSHISEEEEPLDDETLSELMSEDAHHGRWVTHVNDDDDDLLAEQPGEGGLVESTPRRSVEDRLRSACSPQPGDYPSSPATPRASSSQGDLSNGGAAGVSAALARLARQRGDSLGDRDTFGPGPSSSGHRSTSSLDYTEPIEVEDISMTDFGDSLTDNEDEGYDADAVSSQGHGSAYATSPMVASFQQNVQSRTLPGSWEPARTPPALPPPESARDITWGGVLTGRTVSGKSIKIPFDHLDDPPLASPSSGTFGTISHTSSSASNSQGTPSSTNRSLREGHLVHDHESRNLAALAEGREAYRDLPQFRRQDSLAQSYHTARNSPGSGGSGSGSGSGSSSGGSNSRHVPGLAPSTGSSSGSDNESIPSPPASQPVYTTPLPPPPPGATRSPTMEQAAAIPERFKPKPRVVSDDSIESHISAASINSAEMLPSVRARIAALETRDTALRSFGVASAASSTRVLSPQSTGQGLRPAHTGSSGSHGLRTASPGPSQLRPVSPSGQHLRPASPAAERPASPSQQHLRPISPAHTGGSASSGGSKRKSYTAALAPRGASPSGSRYSVTPNPSNMGGAHLAVPGQSQGQHPDDDASVYSHPNDSFVEDVPPRPWQEEDDETPRAAPQATFQAVNVPEADPRASILTEASVSSSSTVRAGIPPAPFNTQRSNLAAADVPAPPKSPVPRGPRPPLRSQRSNQNLPSAPSSTASHGPSAPSSTVGHAPSAPSTISHGPSASIPSGMWLSGVGAQPPTQAVQHGQSGYFDEDETDSRRSSRPLSEVQTVHTFSTEPTTPRWSGSTRSSPSKKSNDPSPSKPSSAHGSEGAFAKLTGRSPKMTPKSLTPEPLEGFARGAQGAYLLNTAGSRSRASLGVESRDSGREGREYEGSAEGHSPLASPRLGALGSVGEHRRNSLQQFIRAPSSTGHGVSYTEGPGYVAETRSPVVIRSATASMEGYVGSMSVEDSGDEDEVGQTLRERSPYGPRGQGQPQYTQSAQYTQATQYNQPAQQYAQPSALFSQLAPREAQHAQQTQPSYTQPTSALYSQLSSREGQPAGPRQQSQSTSTYGPPSSYNPSNSPTMGKLSPHSTGTGGHSSDVSSEWSTGYGAEILEEEGPQPPRPAKAAGRAEAQNKKTELEAPIRHDEQLFSSHDESESATETSGSEMSSDTSLRKKIK